MSDSNPRSSGGNRNRSRSGHGRRGGRSGGRGGSSSRSANPRSGGGNRSRPPGSRPRPSGNRSSGGGPSVRGAAPATSVQAEVRVPAPERSPEASDDKGVQANRRRAWALCLVPALVAGVVLGIVVTAVASWIAGLIVLVVLTVVSAVGLWAASPRVVCGVLGARTANEDEYPRLFNLVDGLCATLGLPAPSIAVIDSPLANALCVGRGPDTALLVVTSGLDDELSLVQLEGVLAHELVHVKQHDHVVSAPAVMVATPYSWFAGPVRGTELVHRLVGPGREFAADQRAARVVRYPPGLEGALETMATGRGGGEWPPARGRLAMLTRWLWIDPRPTGPATAGSAGSDQGVGDLDDTPVRAAALALQ